MYTFDQENHVHMFDGKRLYGVTTILKNWGDPNFLVNWAVNTAVDAIEAGQSPKEARQAHIKVRDKAGGKGTDVHKELETVIEQWIKDGEPVLENVSDITVSVITYLKDNGYTPIHSEINLFSEEMWLGGICDLVCLKDGKVHIMDFKTSGTVQTKYFYQLGAYSKMYQGEKAHCLTIIHIPRGKSFNPKKDVYCRYDVEEMEHAFQSILNVFKIDKKVADTVAYKSTKTSFKI